jgi:hypothetical protein
MYLYGHRHFAMFSGLPPGRFFPPRGCD